jgi:DNA-binding NarL/FixJ family response regulator
MPPAPPILAVMQRTSRRRAPPEPIRVLISDDNELIRISLAAVLTAVGMNVVGSSSNGADAVTAVSRLRPSVVVMDLSMPDMDGVEATRRILAIAPATKIVILTGLTRGAETDAAMAAGAHALVFKDEGSEGVIAAIRRLPT